MGQFQIKAEGYQNMLFKYKFKDDGVVGYHGEYEVQQSNFMLKFPQWI